jgi:Flp pilus assembly protein TadG
MPKGFAKHVLLAMRPLRRAAAIRHDVRGVAAIEFAVLAPLLALMLIGMVDLGIGIHRKMQVQNAVQAGAQFAVFYGFNADLIAKAVLSATAAQGLTASPAPSKSCGCPTASSVTPATCGSPCSGGSVARTYVNVFAQNTYTTLLPYPLFPRSFTFTAQAMVKLQ